MALWSITIKRSATVNGVRFEKGMNVEIVKSNNPIQTSDGKQAIIDAFKRKYDIDLKSTGAISSGSLDIEKL